jgi:Rod binding domain-containing protein
VKIPSDFKPPVAINNPRSSIRLYEDIAEGMESSFTSHMLKEMRKTIPKETPDSSSMDYYNSLLDHERAELMAKSDSGLGVKKIILNQILPEHMKHYLRHQPASQPRQEVPNFSMKENSNE